MENINLIDSFAEFKEFKNIDRATLMRVLEDVFRNMLTKKYGTDENFDIIINIDKGDLEIWRNRTIVEDDKLTNPNPLLSPVCLSTYTFALRIVPYGTNNVVRSESVIS